MLLLGSILAAVLLPVRPADAARQTVAVMPFRDLTQKTRAHVGEAIREVVTNDLKQISDLRVVEPQQEVLRTSIDGDHRAPFQPFGEARRQRNAQVLPALDQLRDPMTDHAWRKAAPDGFDLGKFRHGR